jgi:septal ring factor EnvC (AmiA/AmiB activator)
LLRTKEGAPDEKTLLRVRYINQHQQELEEQRRKHQSELIQKDAEYKNTLHQRNKKIEKLEKEIADLRSKPIPLTELSKGIAAESTEITQIAEIVECLEREPPKTSKSGTKRVTKRRLDPNPKIQHSNSRDLFEPDW